MTGAADALPIAVPVRAARVGTLARVLPIATAVLVFLVGAVAFRPYPVGIYHDDGVYVILAKAIATGHGFHYLHLPGLPLATHYPPIYPLFLAALWRLMPQFPQNMLLLLLAQAALLGVVAFAIQRLLARRLGWSPAACAAFALVATLALPLLTLGSALLSELFFIAALFPVLLASEELAREGASPRRVVLLGACAGLLTLVRTHGIVLVGAGVLVLALRRRWRDVARYLAGALVLVAPWQLWTMMHARDLVGPLRGSYGAYSGWLSRGLAAVGPRLLVIAATRNLREIAFLVADRFAPWPSLHLALAGAGLVAGLAVIGAVALWKRAPVTVAFTAAFLFVVVIVPFTPWRYFWTAWPLVLLLVAAGAGAVVRAEWRHAPHHLPVLSGAAVALLALGAARAELATWRTQAWKAPARAAQAQIAPLVRWVQRHTQPGDVLIADDEPLVYLFTGRQALPPEPFTAAEFVSPPTLRQATVPMRELLTRFPVRYVATIVPSTAAVARLVAADSAPGMPRLQELSTLRPGGAFAVTRP